MMPSNLRQTEFYVEKIQNVVNVGRSSAFQIYTSPGKLIGEFGVIVNPASPESANDAYFDEYAQSGNTVSWFRRALATR